jgi:hypothetical protein
MCPFSVFIWYTSAKDASVVNVAGTDEDEAETDEDEELVMFIFELR